MRRTQRRRVSWQRIRDGGESARVLYRMGRRGMFMGSPKFIRENIREYEAAHLDILNLFCRCGDREHDDIMESLELVATEVMPEFKERHLCSKSGGRSSWTG